MNTTLCRRFPSLDPFAVRRERYHDVLTTFSRLADQAAREGKAKATEDIPKGCIKQVNSKGEVTIMRPAKNDDRW